MSNRRVAKGGSAKHLLFILFVVATFGLVPRAAGAGTITVMWDLMTESNVTGYRVLVGTSSGTYTQTFDVSATSNFFIFRNAFNGVRYYFAVAAQFDGARIGPRSAEVTAVGTRTVGAALPDGARVSDPGVASDCGADCFFVTEVARGLGEIRSIAAANDGTIFVVEAGRRVVALRQGTRTIAFEAAPGTTLRHIALDPQFDANGRVFVSLLRALDGATASLEVLRLRYLAGALGEPATIVGGVSVSAGAAAPIVVGDDGLLYVALPSSTSRHPYSAAVLAFDQDGRVPEGRSSPVVSRGFSNPVGLAWDRQGRTLWVAGIGADGQSQVAAPANGGSAIWSADGSGETVAAIGATEGRKLLISAGPDVVELSLGTGEAVRVPFDEYGVPVAVVSGAMGDRIVAVRRDGDGSYSVLRVANGSSAILR